MSKIVVLDGKKVDARTLLATLLEREDLEGVVVVVRKTDGTWDTTWSTGTTVGGLCMAAMKLDHDVKIAMHEDDV